MSWVGRCPRCEVSVTACACPTPTPAQGLDAATIEREWSLPDLRDLHSDVERIRQHDLGNSRMRDLLRATMDTLVAADVEHAALNTASTTTRGEGARLREAVEHAFNEMRRYMYDTTPTRREMVVRRYRETCAALQGDAAHTSQEKGNG